MNGEKGSIKVYDSVREFLKELDIELSDEDWQLIILKVDVGGLMMAYRKENNLTQKELSKLLGFSRRKVAKLEAGEANPSIKDIARIADRLGYTCRIVFTKRE